MAGLPSLLRTSRALCEYREEMTPAITSLFAKCWAEAAGGRIGLHSGRRWGDLATNETGP